MNFKQWLIEGGWLNDDKVSEKNKRGARGNGSVKGTTIGPTKNQNPPTGLPTPTSNAPLALAKGTMATAQNQNLAQTGIPTPPEGEQPQIKKMKKS